MNIIRKTIALFILASCCVLSMSGCAALAIYYAYESSHNDNLEKYKELQTLRCDKYDNVEYEDIKYY